MCFHCLGTNSRAVCTTRASMSGRRTFCGHNRDSWHLCLPEVRLTDELSIILDSPIALSTNAAHRYLSDHYDTWYVHMYSGNQNNNFNLVNDWADFNGHDRLPVSQKGLNQSCTNISACMDVCDQVARWTRDSAGDVISCQGWVVFTCARAGLFPRYQW